MIRQFLRLVLPHISNGLWLDILKKDGVTIGQNCYIHKTTYIDKRAGWLIEIGDDVSISLNVVILSHDASTKRRFGYTRVGKVKIGDRVFIGAGAIILPGVEIGSDSVIGAGTIVSRDIPSNSLALGSPARVICSTDEFFAKRKKEFEKLQKFGVEYTVQGKVTYNKKMEMRNLIKGRFAYLK